MVELPPVREIRLFLLIWLSPACFPETKGNPFVAMKAAKQILHSEWVKNLKTLSIYDAAYALWVRKAQLDREDFHSRTMFGVPKKQMLKMASVWNPVKAARRLQFEEKHAKSGTTFIRMKAIFENENNSDLGKAVSVAVKFHKDCLSFLQQQPNPTLGIAKAISLAFADNPKISQIVKQDAAHYLYLVTK